MEANAKWWDDGTKKGLVEENIKIIGCIHKSIACLFSRQLLCWNLVEVSLNSRDGLLKLFYLSFLLTTCFGSLTRGGLI